MRDLKNSFEASTTGHSLLLHIIIYISILDKYCRENLEIKYRYSIILVFVMSY